MTQTIRRRSRRMLELALIPWLLTAQSGCALFRPDLVPPDVSLVSVAVESMDLTEQTFICGLRMDNPNDVSLRISGASLKLEVEGFTVGQGQAMNSFDLPALASAQVNVRVQTNLVASLSNAAWLMSSGQREAKYRLTGHVDVGMRWLGRIPIEEEGLVSLANLNLK